MNIILTFYMRVSWLACELFVLSSSSQTPCLPWISYATQKLMLDLCKMLQKQSEVFQTFLCVIFSKFKTQFYCISFFLTPRSHFSRVYSNCCCSCSFEPEIIKIGQSSHKMYSNNILNFQVYNNFKCQYKKSLETYCMHHVLISTEPEEIYLYFPDQIIKIILAKEGWTWRHFIDLVTVRKNKILVYI